ncbi:MAG TPA: hypothetical protein VIX73_35325 [Kofleriaceae bacterium]|jgi:hypothetical protein
MTGRTVLLVLCLAGCGSPNYGAPTATTTIDLQESGGFAGPANAHGVRIVGTMATYIAGTTTEMATLTTSDVAAIIRALEDIDFLNLQADYTSCMSEISDLPSVTITAMVTAGSNTVRHYLGCKGGMFDQLAALDQKIFTLSGYTAWASKR